MKRIFNKYIYALLVALITISFVACDDFLDRSPQGNPTSDDDVSGGVEAKIFGVYSKMRGYDITAGIPAFAIHMFRSEDSEKGSTETDGDDQAAFWDNFEYNATNGILGTYWNYNYSIIHECNTAIDTLQKMDNPVITTNLLRGISTSMFFRLLTLAPFMNIFFSSDISLFKKWLQNYEKKATFYI